MNVSALESKRNDPKGIIRIISCPIILYCLVMYHVFDVNVKVLFVWQVYIGDNKQNFNIKVKCFYIAYSIPLKVSSKIYHGNLIYLLKAIN